MTVAYPEIQLLVTFTGDFGTSEIDARETYIPL